MKKHLCVLLILVTIILAACSFSGEGKAKKTVEGYLTAVKMGDDFEAIDYIEGLIDVFDYEYLQTLDAPEEKDVRTYSYDFWEEYYQDEYDTFEDYKEYLKDLYSDRQVVEDTAVELVLWEEGVYKDLHKFLYNVELANAKGEKLFKKVEFTVGEGLIWDGEEHQDGYVITDIYIR